MKQVDLYGSKKGRDWFWTCDCTYRNFEKEAPEFNPDFEHLTVICPHCKDTFLANLWIPYN